ncbi:unnamed protein product [Lepidochelys kempii]
MTLVRGGIVDSCVALLACPGSPQACSTTAPAVPGLALSVGAGAVLGVLSPVPVTPTHCLCLAACPEPLFKELRKSRIIKAIKTLKEINMAFLPYESQVYSLDGPQTFHNWFSPYHFFKKNKQMDMLAEQIATLCETLEEYPAIRYRKDHEDNFHLAHAVLAKLKVFKEYEPSMGQLGKLCRPRPRHGTELWGRGSTREVEGRRSDLEPARRSWRGRGGV